MRKLFLLSTFFLLAPLIMAISLSLLLGGYSQKHMLLSGSQKVAYAALPLASGTLKTNIVEKDGRVAIVRSFFKKYKSDLLPYADEVIASADRYGLDYRLIPAIAMQESNLCKKLPGNLKDSYNCWGFGVYGKKVTKFSNYAEAIDTVTKTLAKNYKAQGLQTPEQIMSRYTPGSNGSWANGVNQFMAELTTTL